MPTKYWRGSSSQRINSMIDYLVALRSGDPANEFFARVDCEVVGVSVIAEVPWIEPKKGGQRGSRRR